mgnify:CR=1 FL=1
MFDNLVHWINANADSIPFVSAAAAAAPKVSGVRMIEATIIAGVIAAAGYFFMVPRILDKIELEMAYVKKDISNIQAQVESGARHRADIQRQIDRTFGDECNRHPARERSNNREGH